MIEFILASLAIAILSAMSYQPLRKKTKRTFGKVSETDIGVLVRSRAEQKIADTLTRMNIEYVYEFRINNMLCDFYLPEHKIFMEYWGLVDADGIEGEQYRRKMKQKMARYQVMGVRFISIEQRNMGKIEKYLRQEI